MLPGWDGLRFGFQHLAGVGDREAGRKSQACCAWDGWLEQRGCARAEAFKEARRQGLKNLPYSSRRICSTLKQES